MSCLSGVLACCSLGCSLKGGMGRDRDGTIAPQGAEPGLRAAELWNQLGFAPSFPPIPSQPWALSMEPFPAGTGAHLHPRFIQRSPASQNCRVLPQNVLSLCRDMAMARYSRAELEQSLRVTPGLSRAGLGVFGGVRSIELIFPTFP